MGGNFSQCTCSNVTPNYPKPIIRVNINNKLLKVWTNEVTHSLFRFSCLGTFSLVLDGFFVCFAFVLWGLDTLFLPSMSVAHYIYDVHYMWLLTSCSLHSDAQGASHHESVLQKWAGEGVTRLLSLPAMYCHDRTTYTAPPCGVAQPGGTSQCWVIPLMNQPVFTVPAGMYSVSFPVIG